MKVPDLGPRGGVHSTWGLGTSVAKPLIREGGCNGIRLVTQGTLVFGGGWVWPRGKTEEKDA